MNKLEKEKLPELIGPLLLWYEKNKRDLPWRSDVSAYHTWISEIMLQQTRVEAVKGYYTRFLSQFPTVEALANADTDLVLKYWEGLGYYSRARNLQNAAKQVVELYGGVIPKEKSELLKLPGIGSYTAGAIASIAYGKDEPAIDGNAIRVFARAYAYPLRLGEEKDRKLLEAFLQPNIPTGKAGRLNQAIMDLGATVCLPNGTPNCDNCPIRSICKSRIDSCQDIYPISKQKIQRKIENVTMIYMSDKEKVALEKRPEKGLLSHLYGLPMFDDHLSQKEILDIFRQKGVSLVRIRELGMTNHVFSHVEWHILAYEALVDEFGPDAPGDYIYASKEEIGKVYSIPSAFKHFKSEYFDMR